MHDLVGKLWVSGLLLRLLPGTKDTTQAPFLWLLIRVPWPQFLPLEAVRENSTPAPMSSNLANTCLTT